MSFLSGIKNFIKTEILGIEETNTDIQNVKKRITHQLLNVKQKSL